MSIKHWISTGILTAVCAVASSAPQDIVIGQVGQLKDPNSAASQVKVGVQLYFDAVNDRGGIYGAKLKLVTKDRGPDASDSVEKTREIIQEEKPVALIGLSGTAPVEALVQEKVLATAGVPLIGPRTGAVSLHQPVNPWIFHTRANYAQEVQKILSHMSIIGHRRIAILYEKSPFGIEGYDRAQHAIRGKGLQLSGSASYEYGTTHVNEAVATILKAKPDAVIAVATSAATAEFYKNFRQGGSSALVVALSVTDGAAVVKRIGKQTAYGLGIALVVPDPSSKTSTLVREMQEDHKKFGVPGSDLTLAAAEGYIAARVLTEGLKRAGPNPASAKLKRSLESLRELNLGGFSINFSPANHSGSSYVDISVLSPDGRMLR
ncbi:ABC transporter substrate-binding protein [Polaromonas aquatica]|uniref:ABC transporter substrate-binding protein n=1 Tax=Polaromonas aquatica TaxID=332657 RepID=UPI003D65E2F1